MSKLMSTTTDTSKYVPKISLNKPSVQSGRSCGCGLMSSDVVWPNTAKNSRSNATSGVIFSVVAQVLGVRVRRWVQHGWVAVRRCCLVLLGRGGEKMGRQAVLVLWQWRRMQDGSWARCGLDWWLEDRWMQEHVVYIGRKTLTSWTEVDTRRQP